MQRNTFPCPKPRGALHLHRLAIVADTSIVNIGVARAVTGIGGPAAALALAIRQVAAIAFAGT